MGEARPFGRYYDDFEIGDVYKHWPGKTITEYDLQNSWSCQNRTAPSSNWLAGTVNAGCQSKS